MTDLDVCRQTQTTQIVMQLFSTPRQSRKPAGYLIMDGYYYVKVIKPLTHAEEWLDHGSYETLTCNRRQRS